MIRSVNTIVIHCSGSPNGRPETVQEIDRWHRQNGWHRSDYFRITTGFNSNLTSIGYHFVIYVDGTVHTGRHLDEIGAHVAGHNSRSVGICLVGMDRFSPQQWAALKALVEKLKTTIQAAANPTNKIRVMGHCQFDTAIQQGKTCPDFDVPGWLSGGMEAPASHIIDQSG